MDTKNIIGEYSNLKESLLNNFKKMDKVLGMKKGKKNHTEIKNIIQEYWNARTLLVKSFRKMNNHMAMVTNTKIQIEYLGAKATILRDLAKMDKVLGRILSKL